MGRPFGSPRPHMTAEQPREGEQHQAAADFHGGPRAQPGWGLRVPAAF